MAHHAAISKSVAIITMGCAKNEVDSAHMAAQLKLGNYQIVDHPENADAIIINTCSFIQAATEESIDVVLDAARLSNVASGATLLLIAGCMPARYGAELEDVLPEVTRFVPCSLEGNIVTILDELFNIERIGASLHSVPADFGDNAVFAYVNISDGCDRFCSYCTIPFIRGRYHSFTEQEISQEVSSLVEKGTREIVLVAQDTGRWGDDLPEGGSLATLINSLASRYQDTWFRVMYIQPEGITDELINAVASNPNVCNYFDIPFQHCDSHILNAMNRSGSSDVFREIIDRIRSCIPDAIIRTTLIAGFPGETEEQFEKLCNFVEECEFDYVGVFPYSREEPTQASKMRNQLSEEVKCERAQIIRDIADAISVRLISQQIGERMNVLVCGVEEDGQIFGRSMRQAPDVDGIINLSKGEIGEFVQVLIEDTLLYEMEGRVIS